MASGLSSALDDLLDYLVEKATPREILAFKPSEEADRRAQELMDRNNAGTLSAEERVELAQMLQAERLTKMLKAKALAALNRPHKPRIAGLFAGAIQTSDDFDDPLPDEFWLGEE